MKSILFIDDERELWPVIQKIFDKEKYRVICAGDGVEGLQKFRNEDFDLVISDYRMPKVDGYRFFTQMREMEETHKRKETPVLFVSAWIDEIHSKQKNWQGCDFLTKPFQVYELLQKTTKLIGETQESAEKLEGKKFLDAGELLFDEGELSQEMYLIVSGQLAAYKKTAKGDEVQVGTIFAGELIGEMAIIDEAPRSLKVIALVPTELVIIPSEKMKGIINNQPKWVKLMLEGLTKRLRSALKQID